MGRGQLRSAVLGLALLLGVGIGGGACGDASGATPESGAGGGGAAPGAVPGDGGAPRGAAPGGGGGGGASGEALILAAGDISCKGCAQRKTAALLAELSRGAATAAILPLGDQAYSNGSLSDFKANYAPSWGVPELLALSHPVPGNHEYDHTKGQGYFDYFNGVGAATGIAGTRGEGYYSFDIGTWHLVALNSSNDCNAVACDLGSPQQAWLAADLAAHPARCTLAYWHVPRFQGGDANGESDDVGPLWDTLYDAGADVVITAHEHNYQQLTPLDKAGERDGARGIRSFVVGTGGAGFHKSFGGPHAWALEARVTGTHGVLELTLLEGGYRWRFVAADGSVPDGASGSATCH